jgi:hypothetical protein
MSNEEQLAKMRADMDQARAAMGEMAGAVGDFYRELRRQELSVGESVALTGEYLRALLQPRPEDDE